MPRPLNIVLEHIASPFSAHIENQGFSMTAMHSTIELSRKVAQCIQQQQWHQAKHHCQRLLKLDPEDGQAHQLLGLIHIQLARMTSTADTRNQHTDRAIHSFQLATRHEPRMFDAFLNLGNALLQANRASEALQAFQSALTLKPETDLVYANQAEAYRQQGDHANALASLSQAIQLAPAKHGYLVKTGNLLRDIGHHEQAIQCYEQAIHIEPNQAEAYAQMAVSMEALGHHDAALGCCKIALEIDPSQPTALYHRGLLEIKSNDQEAALVSLSTSLELQPQSAHAWFSKGMVLLQQKQYASALTAFDNAIELGITTSDAFQQRALCHQELDQLDSAINDLEAALKIDPHHAVSLMTLGVISQKLGRFEAAINFYTQSIESDPQRVEAYSNLGAVLFESKRFEDARVTLEAAIELNPKLINAWNNLGATLMELYRFKESLDAFEQVLRLEPQHVDALCHKGLVLHNLDRIDEALTCYDKALAIDPDSTLAQWNKAIGLLLKGDFHKGWQQYEARWSHKKTQLQLREYPQPRWTADSSLENKHVFVYQEQGLGDTLMFARFIPKLVELGAHVTFEVQPSLFHLLTRCLPQAQIISMGQPVPDFDLHTPLLSVPALLHLQEEEFSNSDQYLCASSAKLEEWERRLGTRSQPRIGLVWSGNAAHQNDRNRSMSLDVLLGALPKGFDYISLQNQVRPEDSALLENAGQIRSFTDSIQDFEDTAALCQCMDLVISVDTSVAHLSAALGKVTWVMIPYSPDWRWMKNRQDTPWYSCMQLYRQTTPGCWEHPLTSVANALTNLLQPPSSQQVAKQTQWAIAA